MKKIIFLAAAVLLTACSDYFETDSNSVIKTDGQTYNSELEARSGLFGLLQGLQNVGDNYVLMGELRADLMTTTDNSSQELRDICNLNIKSDNSYLKQRQWYSLVNNCNYYIAHLDTAVTQLKNGEATQYMLPYMAQAKAIRAWAYLNMCLDYGYVKYTEQPLLDAENSANATDSLGIEELTDRLIASLTEAKKHLPASTNMSAASTLEYSDPGFTSSVNYEGYSARQLMFPINFVLGELYMWKADYRNAVQCYYNLILQNQLKLCQYRNTYDSSGTTVSSRTWTTQFSGFNYSDILTAIVYDANNASTNTRLYNMANGSYTIAPSASLISTFETEEYFASRSISGDTRGLYGTYTMRADSNNGEDAYISKYSYMTASSNRYVSPCRASLVWLRYAECLNRLEKPRLAFMGFLKLGLSAYNMQLYSSIFKEELASGEKWINYGQDNLEGELAKVFSANTRGFHARGCGNTDLNEIYVMEELPTLNDSILWVEEQLLKEYALETAFEGNRFHDLMRVSKYRNSPAFLAEKVSAKFQGAQQSAVYNRLLDKKNWYLPVE